MAAFFCTYIGFAHWTRTYNPDSSGLTAEASAKQKRNGSAQWTLFATLFCCRGAEMFRSLRVLLKLSTLKV